MKWTTAVEDGLIVALESIDVVLAHHPNPASVKSAREWIEVALASTEQAIEARDDDMIKRHRVMEVLKADAARPADRAA